jgi:hypothetical protein
MMPTCDNRMMTGTVTCPTIVQELNHPVGWFSAGLSHWGLPHPGQDRARQGRAGQGHRHFTAALPEYTSTCMTKSCVACIRLHPHPHPVLSCSEESTLATLLTAYTCHMYPDCSHSQTASHTLFAGGGHATQAGDAAV